MAMQRAKVPGAKDILYGQTPYGWRLSRDRSKLVEDRAEQRIIAIVRHMYLVRRLPMRDIVRELKGMGVVNRRGQPFGLSRVWEMIHRPSSPPAEARASAGDRAPKSRKRRR
jgi:hypothetical protein